MESPIDLGQFIALTNNDGSQPERHDKTSTDGSTGGQLLSGSTTR